MSLRSIEHRLDALAARFAPRTPMVVRLRGGPHGREPLHAVAGERRWNLQDDESVAAFRERVIKLAVLAGAPVVVIAGCEP